MIISTLLCIVSLSSCTTIRPMTLPDLSDNTSDLEQNFHSLNIPLPLSARQIQISQSSYQHVPYNSMQSPQTIIGATTVYWVFNNDYHHQHPTLRERRQEARKKLDVLAQQEALASSSNYTKRQRKTDYRTDKKAALLSELLEKLDKSQQPRPEELFLNLVIDQNDITYPELYPQEQSINWDELQERLNPWVLEESEPYQPNPYPFNFESSPVN